MNNPEGNVEAANRFGAVARQFCSIVDSAQRIDRTELLAQIYRTLPKLIDEAIKLPEVKLRHDDDQSGGPGASSSPANVRLTDEQWAKLYNLLKEKLGDWDLYWQVFDPTTDKDAVCGTLADDFADIYRDLKEGLVLNETLQGLPEEIIWDWRLHYYSHWGKHAIDALLTIHFRLQGILE